MLKDLVAILMWLAFALPMCLLATVFSPYMYLKHWKENAIALEQDSRFTTVIQKNLKEIWITGSLLMEARRI